MTGSRTIVTAGAESDLKSIAEYLLAKGGIGGLLFVEELEQAVYSIEEFPERFALIPLRASYGIRRRVCGPYLIFYVVDREQVTILRILHGAQDYESLLFGGS